MSMMKFMQNRKKENRQSLIIDNLDFENFKESLKLKRNSSLRSQSSSNEQSESENKHESESENRQSENRHESTILDNNSNNQNEHTCNLCLNKNKIKDAFMILTCGHIFHIRCLVDSHYTDSNKYGIIDEQYFNSRCCLVCNLQMEMEDILYVHNKFYKNTKEYLVKQEEHINILDKQMTKLKEELRICYEYKQRLEHQREKSKQITITINTLI